jgi:phenylacetate-CoA ligase
MGFKFGKEFAVTMVEADVRSEQLVELRVQRLRHMIKLCLAAHPFYRQRFRGLGLGPADIRSLDDLEKLPLTTKNDYMICPDDFRLRAADVDGMSLEESTLWNVAYTTGTTSGKPSPFFNTTHDQFTIMMQARRCATVEGMMRGDTIANLIPLPPVPTGGFLIVGRTAEAMGIPVVSALTGAKNPNFPIHRGLDEAIDCIAAANPSVFWGIPSFVRRFFRRAQERGIRFHSARMAVVTGEPVSQALRAELTDHLRTFGAAQPQVRARYSCTEMQGGLVQCCNDAALQNVVPDIYYLEVVDPETGRRMPEGEEGALALTHLHRRGTVFLRYLVGDMIGLRMEQCPHCGIWGERIVSSPRRTGTLLKIKGMLVNPNLVLEVLSAERAINEFQLIVRKSNISDPDSMDVLVVRLEAVPQERARLTMIIPDLVQRIIMVRPEMQFVEPGEIYDPMKSIKAKRLIDERQR